MWLGFEDLSWVGQHFVWECFVQLFSAGVHLLGFLLRCLPYLPSFFGLRLLAVGIDCPCPPSFAGDILKKTFHRCHGFLG